VNEPRRIVLQQLYPGFFNDETDWCDGQTMGIFPGYRPLLTKALRHKLNRLAESVRDQMKKTIENYVPPYPMNGNRLFYLDEFDYLHYPGHRFCEPDIEELDNPNIWFFTIGGHYSPTITAQQLLDRYDPDGCADDPKYNTDFVFGWYCDQVRYLTTLSGNHSDFVTFTPDAPESVMKAFHPKTAAFTSIKNNHKNVIIRLGYLREEHVDQGNLQCLHSHTDGDKKWYASREDMEKAVGEFCQSAASAGVSPGLIEGVYNGLFVSAEKNRLATNCLPLDVTSKGFANLCRSRLRNTVDGCKCPFPCLLVFDPHLPLPPFPQARSQTLTTTFLRCRRRHKALERSVETGWKLLP
jgi:hypothetical protein